MQNNLFTPKKLMQLENGFVVRTLRERRDEILGAISDRTVEPTMELMKELAEINVALGDVPAEDEAFQ